MEKRQVMVRLDIEVLAGMVRQGQVMDFEIIEGIPPDAKMVEWWPEERERRELIMVFEHPRFEPVPLDADPPEKPIVCKYYEQKEEEGA